MQDIYKLKQLRELIEIYSVYESKIKEYIKLTKIAIKDQRITNKSLKKSATKLEYQTGKYTIKELKRKRKRAKLLTKKIKKMRHALILIIKNFQNKHLQNVWNVELNLEIKDLIIEINKKRGITKEEYLPHIEKKKDEHKLKNSNNDENNENYDYGSFLNEAPFNHENIINDTPPTNS